MLENNLYKDRSYSSCIHAAYELMCNNFTAILKKTWGVVLLYSIIFALTPFTNSKIFTSVLLLASFLLKSWTDTIILSLLNDKSHKSNFIAIIQVVLFNFGLIALFSLIFYFANDFILHKAPTFASNLYLILLPELLILVLLILQPMIFPNMKYLIHGEENYLKVLKLNYKYGWKYWGFMTAVLILISIITVAILLVITMPLIISAIINAQNTIGVLMGDANGLPSYYNTLNYVICAVSIFFTNYFSFWWIFVMYYIYGNIAARIKAKNQNTEKYDE